MPKLHTVNKNYALAQILYTLLSYRSYIIAKDSLNGRLNTH